MSALSNESFSHYRCVEVTLPFSAVAQRLKIGGLQDGTVTGCFDGAGRELDYAFFLAAWGGSGDA